MVVSFISLLVAVAGTILGVVRTVAARWQRRPSLSFFSLKWLRRHHLISLFVSVFLFGWILSGWLSMDHCRLSPRGVLSRQQASAYFWGMIGGGLRGFAAATVARIPEAREIDFSVVAGWPVLTA